MTRSKTKSMTKSKTKSTHKPIIRHLVTLDFKADTPRGTKQVLYQDLNRLREHIDGIIDFQTRSNICQENELVRGSGDLIWFDFRDSKARDAYLADEKHQAIGARIIAELKGGTDGIFVFDFEV